MFLKATKTALALCALALTTTPTTLGAQDGPTEGKNVFRLRLDTGLDAQAKKAAKKAAKQAAKDAAKRGSIFELEAQDGDSAFHIDISENGVKLNGKKLELLDLGKLVGKIALNGERFELADVFAQNSDKLEAKIREGVQDLLGDIDVFVDAKVQTQLDNVESVIEAVRNAKGGPIVIDPFLQGKSQNDAMKHLRDAQAALRRAMAEIHKQKKTSKKAPVRRSVRVPAPVSQKKRVALEAARKAAEQSRHNAVVKRYDAQRKRYTEQLAKLEARMQDQQNSYHQKMHALSKKKHGDETDRKHTELARDLHRKLQRFEKEREQLTERIERAEQRVARLQKRSKENPLGRIAELAKRRKAAEAPRAPSRRIAVRRVTPQAAPTPPARVRTARRSSSRRASGAHEHPELWNEVQSLRRELEKVRRDMSRLQRDNARQSARKRSKIH